MLFISALLLFIKGGRAMRVKAKEDFIYRGVQYFTKDKTYHVLQETIYTYLVVDDTKTATTIKKNKCELYTLSKMHKYVKIKTHKCTRRIKNISFMRYLYKAQIK